MDRRRFLGFLGGLGGLLAGCTGRTQQPAADSDPTTTATDEPSPTDAPTPTGWADLDVPPCPERPETFTEETAASFATQFERAYVTRVTLRDTSYTVTSITVRTDDPTVTATDDGWLVTIDVIGPASRFRREDGTSGHADPGTYTASYHLSDDAVRRATAVDPVDPRERGTAVTCPP